MKSQLDASKLANKRLENEVQSLKTSVHAHETSAAQMDDNQAAYAKELEAKIAEMEAQFNETKETMLADHENELNKMKEEIADQK